VLMLKHCHLCLRARACVCYVYYALQVPGSSFECPRPSHRASDGAKAAAEQPDDRCRCFRASFTLVTSAEYAEKGMMRLAEVLAAHMAGSGNSAGPVGIAMTTSNDHAAALLDKQQEIAVLEGRIKALRAEVAELTAQ